MKAIGKRRVGITKTTLFSALIFSALATQANTVGEEINHMVHNSENLTIVYVIGGMFIVCLMLYLLGAHFAKKDHQRQNMVKQPQQRYARQRVIKKTS